MIRKTSGGGVAIHMDNEEDIMAAGRLMDSTEISLTTLRSINATPAYDNDKDLDKKTSISVPAPSVNNLNAQRIYQAHQTASAQYLRDAILGVNDGLVSMFLLTLGLVGGGQNSTAVLLAALTGALAGAISMALGEYIATKSQAQVTRSEIALERVHLQYHREKELGEVRSFLSELALEGELLERVVSAIGKNDEAMIRLMMAFEFGFQEELERNPLKAMLMSGGFFLTGSLPSVLPYACTNDVNQAFYASIACAVCALFFIGAVKTRSTKGPWLYDGCENLFLGAIGGAVTYALGAAYNTRGSS